MQKFTIEDLMPFCADSRTRRHAIEAPYSDGGLVAATDGRIMVAIPDGSAAFSLAGLAKFREDRSLPSPPSIGPIMSELWEAKEKSWSIAKFEAPAKFPPPSSWIENPCCDCGGTGVDSELNEARTVRVPCQTCDGWKRGLAAPLIVIGGYRLNPLYVEMISGLPGAAFLSISGPWENSMAYRMGALFFEFDGGGQGAVMPLRDFPPGSDPHAPTRLANGGCVGLLSRIDAERDRRRMTSLTA